MAFKVGFNKETRTLLDRIAVAMEQLVFTIAASRFTFHLSMKGLDMVYKADKADFDWRVVLGAVDSEGNVISDAPIPAGHVLTITSDNDAAFTAVQDGGDPKLIHSHVGSPGQANVVANLTDPAGNLVMTGAALVTVTVGDPTAVTELALNLPAE